MAYGVLWMIDGAKQVLGEKKTKNNKLGKW